MLRPPITKGISMRHVFSICLALGALGCGGSILTDEGSGALSRPSGWIPWSAGIAEPADEPTSTACGHECPGSPWTHVGGTCATIVTAGADGTAHLAVDWASCDNAPLRKDCRCADPRSDPNATHGEISFVVKTDEASCAKVREMWRAACH